MAINKYAVKGKSSEQLLDLSMGEFNALSRKELSQVVSRLGRTAKGRVKTLEKYEMDTPALMGFKERGGFKGVRGKSLNELRADYINLSRFLKAKTSSKRGYETFKNEVSERLNVDKEMTEEDWKKYWRLYNRIDDAKKQSLGSEKLQELIYQDVFKDNENVDIDTLYDNAREMLRIDYETRERKRDTSSYVTI